MRWCQFFGWLLLTMLLTTTITLAVAGGIVRKHLKRHNLNLDRITLSECLRTLDTGDVVMLFDRTIHPTANLLQLLAQGHQELPFVHLACVFKDTHDWFGNGRGGLHTLEWRLVGGWKVIPFERRTKKLLDGHAVVRRLRYREKDYTRLRQFCQQAGLFGACSKQCDQFAFLSSVLRRFVLKTPFHPNMHVDNCTDALVHFLEATRITGVSLPTNLNTTIYDCFYAPKLLESVPLGAPQLITQ